MNSEINTSGISDISQRQASRIAGFSYLIVFILGIFANSIAFENLVVPGDVSAHK